MSNMRSATLTTIVTSGQTVIDSVRRASETAEIWTARYGSEVSRNEMRPTTTSRNHDQLTFHTVLTSMSDKAVQIERVHRALFPEHGPTPLRALPSLATELGVKAVYVKDESSRFGLPAFKILGASWATASLLADRWGVDPWDIDALKRGAASEPDLTIFTATDGESPTTIPPGFHGGGPSRRSDMLHTGRPTDSQETMDGQSPAQPVSWA